MVTPRTKSARIAAISSSVGEESKKDAARPLQEQRLKSSRIDIDDFNCFFDNNYNRLLPFAQHLSGPARSRACEAASEVEHGARNIEAILQKASEDLREEMLRIERHGDGLQDAIAESSDTWYTHGDLTRKCGEGRSPLTLSS